MKACLYRFFLILFLFGNLFGLPYLLVAQKHVQMAWDSFDAAVDSLEEKGKKDEAKRWLKERETQALRTENWEELLGCINRYCEIIRPEDPIGREQKILASRWIPGQISELSEEVALYHFNLGDIYLTNLRKVDSSRIFIDQAMADFRELEIWDYYTYAAIVKGLSYFFEGKYEDTEKWWWKGLDSASVHLPKKNSAVPAMLSALAAFYSTSGNYDKSLVISQRTIDMYEGMGPLSVVDSQFMGVAYYNKGVNLLEMNDYDQALDHLQHAQFVFSNLSVSDPKDMIFTMIHEGIINWEVGKKEEAFQIWMEMLKKTENQPNYEDERLLTTVYQYLADYHIREGKMTLAMDYLLRANQIESIEKSNTTPTLLSIGNLYLLMEKPDLAKRWLDKALEHAKETFDGRHPTFSSIYLGFANYYSAIDQPLEAIEQYQLALMQLSEDFNDTAPASAPSIDEVHDKMLFLKTLEAKANLCKDIYLESKEEQWLNISAQTFDLAITLIDHIRASFSTEGSKLKLAETAQRVYDGAIQLTLIRFEKNPDQDLLKKAFSFAEKNKGLSLREALQESDAKQFAGIPPDLLAREQKLKTELSFYRKKIFDADPSLAEDSLKLVLWKNKQFELRKAFLELIDTLENNYSEYYELKYRDKSIGAEEVMAQLEPGSALIEYFWGEEALVIFCLTNDSIWTHRLKIDAEFLEVLNQFQAVLKTKPSDIPGEYIASHQKFGKTSFDLYNKLVASVMGKKDIQELLIISDGPLGYIPFEALVTSLPESTDSPAYAEFDYLFKACKVRYEYAAAFLDYTYAGKRNQKNLLGFAPAYDKNLVSIGENASRSNWQALRFNQEELQQIYDQIGGQAYTAEQATKSRFLTEASMYSMLHLAMHGFINDENPLYSGLVFSPESSANQDSLGYGILYAYELYNLSLQAELAVLSACNTGNGQLLKGEGIMSMARAFRYAGCPSIVMSLWTADDRATIRLMEFFYKNLAAGMEKDAALQAAREAYLNSTRRDHPYYWAGFVLIGNEDALSTSPVSRRAMLFGGGGLLLILLVLAMRKAIFQRKG